MQTAKIINTGQLKEFSLSNLWEWINMSPKRFDLEVKLPSYPNPIQRPFVWDEAAQNGWIAQMEQNLMYNKTPLLWVKRDGKHLVIDGRQRLETLSLVAYQPWFESVTLPVHIITASITDAQIVQLFLDVNTLYYPQSPEHLQMLKTMLAEEAQPNIKTFV